VYSSHDDHDTITVPFSHVVVTKRQAEVTI
jgi:hypothetical protein